MSEEEMQNKSDELKKIFLRAYEKSLNISETCKAVGICRKTFYNWLESDEEFKQAINELEERKIDFAEDALLKEIAKGNITAIIFFLKTKAKKRGYAESFSFDNLNNTIKVEFLEAKEGNNANSESI